MSLFAWVSHLMILAVAVDGSSGNWPEYRGPTCDGRAQVNTIPLHWSENRNVRWRTPIHDRGWSTPVIRNGQIWLTTARMDGKEMYVICVDRESGDVLVDKKIFDVPNPRPLGNDLNCYASPSPTIEAERVYIHFGSYGTACLDTQTAEVLWQRRDLPCNHLRGPASSLVLWKNLLIFHMDGSDHHYVVALEKTTGKTVWKVQRSTDYNDLDPNGEPTADGDYRKAYNTPLLIDVDGHPQLISPSAKAVYAYSPKTGREIWQVRHQGHSTACRTLYDGQLIFVNTGHGKTELLAINPRGTGDTTESHIAWRQHRYVPVRSSPVLVDRLIYSSSKDGVVSCVDSKSGNLVWRKRIGGKFSSSTLFADGRIYFFSQEGESVVISPGQHYHELARNHLPTGFMASPIALENALYLRTKTHLYRIEKQ